MTVSVTPVPKPRMTRRDVWAERPAVVAYRAYGDELRLRLHGRGYQLPAQLRVIFHMPMPTSWSRAKRLRTLGQPHQQRPDIDNLLKGLLDHLAEEDCYVWHVEAKKVWSEQGMVELL